MIAHIRGKLLHRHDNTITVDVHGIGYEVTVSANALHTISEAGGEVSITTVTVVSDDTIRLYGFAGLSEKSLFMRLRKIPGIGMKNAMNLISHLPMDRFLTAIENQDTAAFKRVPGIGGKTAGRIVSELKDDAKSLRASLDVPSPTGGHLDEVYQALANLGFQDGMISHVMQRLQPTAGTDLQDLLKQALKIISQVKG